MAESVSDSKNFGDVLVREGLISEEQHRQGRDQYSSGERPLSRIFVEMGAISEGTKIGILQKKYNVPVISLKDVTPRPDAVAQVPRDICEKYRVVPLRIENNRLVVAMEDPTDPHAIAALEASSSHALKTFVAKSGEIAETIRQMPAVEPAAKPERGASRKIVATVSLLGLALIPPVGAAVLMLYNDGMKQFYFENLERFEQILVTTLAMCAWAIVAYWINDIIFGEKREEPY